MISQCLEAAEGCVTVKFSLAGHPSQNQLHFHLKPAEDTGLAARTRIRCLELEDRSDRGRSEQFFYCLHCWQQRQWQVDSRTSGTQTYSNTKTNTVFTCEKGVWRGKKSIWKRAPVSAPPCAQAAPVSAPSSAPVGALPCAPFSAPCRDPACGDSACGDPAGSACKVQPVQLAEIKPAHPPETLLSARPPGRPPEDRPKSSQPPGQTTGDSACSTSGSASRDPVVACSFPKNLVQVCLPSGSSSRDPVLACSSFHGPAPGSSSTQVMALVCSPSGSSFRNLVLACSFPKTWSRPAYLPGRPPEIRFGPARPP
ncbi:uncharacterized protein LOC121636384 [Melanotaenia boesemani]|uniref:uncharacterized protein LOC121636384 n=1 Tax=Melanotaenia boesemani TaxID=1250792 RepID=UPI001C058A57|nr:uncharacterized protein LOC121636384 [Melanotaenia boesemani]